MCVDRHLVFSTCVVRCPVIHFALVGSSCERFATSGEHIAQTSEHGDAQFDALEREGVGPSERPLRISVAQYLAVFDGHFVVAVHVFRAHVTWTEVVALLCPFSHFSLVLCSVLPDALVAEAVEYAERLTDEEGVVRHVVLTVCEFHDFILLISSVEAGFPLEAVAQLHRECVEGDFNTVVLGLTHIGVCEWESREGRDVGLHDDVVGAAPVEFQATPDAAVEESEVETEVPLSGLFPTEFRVCHCQLRVRVVRFVGCITNHVAHAVEWEEDAGDITLGLVRRNGCVACDTHTETYLQVANPVDVLDEFLFAGTPSEGCGWEEIPLVSVSQLGSTVPTSAGSDEITFVETVVQTNHVRFQLTLYQA